MHSARAGPGPAAAAAPAGPLKFKFLSLAAASQENMQDMAGRGAPGREQLQARPDISIQILGISW